MENFGVIIVVDTKELQIKLAKVGADLDRQKMLRMIGAGLLKWVNDNFRAEGLEKKWKPLSPNTIAGRRKGSGKILQNTGRLRMSFIDAYGADWVSVGSNDQRALWHHVGTRPYRIYAKNARALAFRLATFGPFGFTKSGKAKTDKGALTFRKWVDHPGLPSRQLLPSTGVASELVMRNVNAYVEAVLRKHGAN